MMSCRPYVVLLGLALALPSASVAQTDPFVGTFVGGGITLVLFQSNGRYTGQATIDGEDFTVTAERGSDQAIVGSYDYFGELLRFRATISGDVLSVTTDDGILNLQRQPSTAGVPGAANASGGAAIAANELIDPAWGVRFTVPEGWTGQKDGGIFVMGSDTYKGLIAVMPHEATSIGELREGAEEGIVEENTRLTLLGEPARFADRGMSAEFVGTVDGSPAKAYAIALLPEFETGALIIAMTSPEAYDDSYAGFVESIANSLRFPRPQSPPITMEWKRDLSGMRLTYMWSYYSGVDASGASAGGSQRTVIDVCPGGYFSYYDSNDMSINSGGGSYNVSAGGGGIERGMGTWDVVARGDDPYLQLSFRDGRVWEYAVEWKDDTKLYMDGSRYFRTDGSAGVDDGPAC